VDNYAQSACATSASECHLAASMGPGTFLKDRKFCEDGFLNFFLQGPKLKRDIFAGMSVIFKPRMYDECTLEVTTETPFSRV